MLHRVQHGSVAVTLRALLEAILCALCLTSGMAWASPPAADSCSLPPGWEDAVPGSAIVGVVTNRDGTAAKDAVVYVDAAILPVGEQEGLLPGELPEGTKFDPHVA